LNNSKTIDVDASYDIHYTNNGGVETFDSFDNEFL
jgi:hypothetical protein